MDLDLSKIIEHIVTLGFGTVVAWFAKIRRDVNSSFKKIRELERQMEDVKRCKNLTKELELLKNLQK